MDRNLFVKIAKHICEKSYLSKYENVVFAHIDKTNQIQSVPADEEIALVADSNKTSEVMDRESWQQRHLLIHVTHRHIANVHLFSSQGFQMTQLLQLFFFLSQNAAFFMQDLKND